MGKRICFIIQRYGLEVNGGAELHCRQLAEHLLKKYSDIHVLTTKAIDYMTWRNEYEADEEIINGIRVHRFPVVHERDQDDFNVINDRFFRGLLPEEEEELWLEKQGPYVPALPEYLKAHKDDFDVFIPMTYLYYTMVKSIEIAADRAIVIPTAHDEPFLRMKMYEKVFTTPRAFFYNTEEERQLIRRKYHNGAIPSDLGGVGVDLPEHVSGADFREKYGLENYVVYVGRIDEGKNCDELFRYFTEYKKRNPGDLKLVLMGKPVIPVPKTSDIVSLGFVSDEDKFNGIDGARALLLPSKFESLSMVVLEAMSLRTPVMVNGACEVLRGHCTKSNGAFYYNNYFEFEGELNYLLTRPDVAEIMAANAKEYVDSNYTWDIVVSRLSRLIEMI